jgi:hypothetical protein
MKADVKEIKADIKTKQAKTYAKHEEMMAKLDVHHEGMKDSVNAWRKEMTVCQEEKEAYPEKRRHVQKKWNPERSMRRSLNKMLKWKLAER